MQKHKLGLFSKILIAIVGGVVLGWLLGDPWAPCGWALKAVNAFSGVFGQILRFIVPLLILGLVTPAIAETGRGAGKVLLAVVLIAYGSTVFAGFLAYFGSALVFPSWLTEGIGTLAGVAKTKPLLEIPPVMNVMTSSRARTRSSAGSCSCARSCRAPSRWRSSPCCRSTSWR